MVTGCSNAIVDGDVCGSYGAGSVNHGRTVYRKIEQVYSFNVLVYYWDDPEGPNFCG